MWQALISWFYAYMRAKEYHRSKSRHSRRYSDRITEWVTPTRMIDVIFVGADIIVRHNIARV